jgi:uncharacterized membrane protein
VGRHAAQTAIAEAPDRKIEALGLSDAEGHGKLCALTDRGMAARSAPQTGSIHAVEENVEAIKSWDRALLLKRSQVERLSDGITLAAASGVSMILHTIWFIAWIVINIGLVPGLEPFDPFPFPLLTMMVSLEAIFLALFVLSSQNRLAKQSDLRANLDLQIDLLVEREMTAVLQLLNDIAKHLDVNTDVTTDQISDLIKKTDVKTLAEEVDRQPARP